MTYKAKPLLITVGAIFIALFPLLRWIAAVYLRNAPQTYFSVVIIEIKPDLPDPADHFSSVNSSGRIEPRFPTKQIQRIQTAEILTPVIEKLDLVKRLSPPGTTMPMQWVTEVLLRTIVVQEQRNTTLVEIGVYHADKQLAADIANTIAVTYRDKRMEDLRKNEERVLAEMKAELIAKREEVGRLLQEATRIRQEDEIVDPDPEDATAILSFGAEGGSKMIYDNESTRVKRYVEKKAAYVVAKALLHDLQKQIDHARFDNQLSQSPVKIWQRAVPTQTPVRPDAVAILRLVNIIGGSLAAIGVVLIFIGVRMKFPKVPCNADTGMHPDLKD